jgi:hypothetical protein
VRDSDARASAATLAASECAANLLREHVIQMYVHWPNTVREETPATCEWIGNHLASELSSAVYVHLRRDMVPKAAALAPYLAP